MSDQLQKEQLEAYRNRTLGKHDLSVLTLHLSHCRDCIEVYQKMFPEITNLQREVMVFSGDEYGNEPFHLEYELHLRFFVNDEISDIDREIVEGHVRTCGHCASMLRDLQEFRELIEVQEDLILGTDSWWARLASSVRSNFGVLPFSAWLFYLSRLDQFNIF